MSVNARLLGAIWIATLLVMVGFTLFQIEAEHRRVAQGLETRASLLGEGVKEAFESAAAHGSAGAVQRVLRRFDHLDRGIAVYDRLAHLVAATPSLTSRAIGPLPEVKEAITTGAARHGVRTIDGRTTVVYATPFDREAPSMGALAVLLDGSSLDFSKGALSLANTLRFGVLALVLSLVTLLVVHSSITQPLTEIARWTRTLKTGHQAAPPPDVPGAPLFGSLAREVSGLATSLVRARRAAEREAALRLRGESLWTEERLKQFVSLRFSNQQLVVVSNREPVSHVWQDGKIVAMTPASGLVTAMDPLLRACGGVWVAHGSGDADFEAADEHGRLALPPDDPRYTLRRVWLSKQEEDGYYYGFANEGLWPLCHIVHTRPVFRPEDWRDYADVNRKFAATVFAELQGAGTPMVLIQDYHFALLPTLIKAERPDARVALFWHIPWPNPEAFGICPWQREILEGMLGADLIGFQIQYHCNNFLETVERTIECRVDWEHFSVVRGQHATPVKPFPIGVAQEYAEEPPETSRQELLAGLGISAEFLGVGVERIDYTKGLPERFLAIQRFFERYPAYRERLVFVQLAAPSRSRIKRYQDLQLEIEQTVERVNRAVGTRGWRPIVYLKRHHDRLAIWPFYRHADFCMVTSLHDGMNLVAKEFVSVRDDNGGALILSRFTGGAHQLRDALLVNPYDLDEMAESIRTALEMPPDERAARMARMREVVGEQNIHQWAGLLLNELARVPAEPGGGVS